MENGNTNDQKEKQEYNPFNSQRRSRLAAGFMLVAIGGVFLARALGVLLPEWLFSWKIIFALAGLFIGISYSFRGAFWLLLILVSFALLAPEIFPGHNLGPLGWPVVLIVLGLYFLLRKKRKRYSYEFGSHWHGEKKEYAPGTYEDYIDAVAIFGEIKKTPLSKKFKGGDVAAIFGSVQVNLMNADLDGTAILDLSAVMGAIQLIVPSHWRIKSEVAAVLGGIEDKREVKPDLHGEAEKTLVLTGAAVMGGIEIKSF